MPAGRAPRELEPRRGPNMKGARKRRDPEVPVPLPREVQPPPDWTWRMKREVLEPTSDGDPGEDPAPEPQEETQKTPRKGTSIVTEVPETRVESRSKVVRQELPSRAPQEEKAGPSTTNGRPKRPTRPPKCLSDFQLCSMKACRAVTRQTTLGTLQKNF